MADSAVQAKHTARVFLAECRAPAPRPRLLVRLQRCTARAQPRHRPTAGTAARTGTAGSTGLVRMTAPLPVSPATVVEATKASSPVAAVVSAMRRVDPAGAPVSASQVRTWADTLMKALYTAQPVRWEYRRKDDVAPNYWVQADAGHVYAAHQRGLVVRALFETPRVIQPEKVHDFQRRVCMRCGISEDWAGPDCFPPDNKPDPRTLLPVDPSWLVEPLKWIRDAGPMPLSTHERRRRANEAAFLIEKLEALILECNTP